MKLFRFVFFFGGFFISNLFDTTVGSLFQWPILGSAFIVANFESFNKVYYEIVRAISLQQKKKNRYIIRSLSYLNYFKQGIIYGFIVDAFKLGS